MSILLRIAPAAKTVVFIMLLLNSTLFAATITVTNPGDTIALLDGVTLREAITAANTNAASGDAPAGSIGLDTIVFAIVGLPDEVHTIQPGPVPLPTITEALIINGYSQTDASVNTLAVGTNAALKIEIDGSLAGLGAEGLTISASGVTIQGLIINRFGGEGILITGANNQILGNFLGTDAAGSVALPNLGSGVRIEGLSNVVGGLALADRNLISGNTVAGVTLATAAATGNRIINNLIGTDATSLLALPNGVGVAVTDAINNFVGGFLAGEGNIIAFNTAEGILHTVSGTGNSYLRNSIHSNGALGIDLGGDGVTMNDPLDPDVGVNDLQNFPTITAATSNTTGTRVTGTLSSLPSIPFRIEIFANIVGDTSGNGEGQTYLGSVDVTTDAAGAASFLFTSTVVQPVGTIISATATSSTGNTSEFSANLAVISAPLTDETSDDDEDDDSDVDFVPVPVPPPPPPPFPPVPPVAGPIADVPPAGPIGAPPPPVAAAVDAEAEDVLSDEITIRSDDSASKKKMPATEATEESGCSTTGADGSFMGLLLCLMLALRSLHRKKKLVE